MSKELPRVTDIKRIWEQMPWDTSKSYQMFLAYYLVQDPPRSVNEAFRRANPVKVAQGEQDTREAPSNWRRWSMGKDKSYRDLKYILVKDDGVEYELPVPSWAERAEAYDKWRFAEALRSQEQRVEQLRAKAQQTVEGAFTKIAQAWANYSPSRQERLIDLVRAQSRLLQDMQAVFGGELFEYEQATWREMLPEEVSPDELFEFLDRAAMELADEQLEDIPAVPPMSVKVPGVHKDDEDN